MGLARVEFCAKILGWVGFQKVTNVQLFDAQISVKFGMEERQMGLLNHAKCHLDWERRVWNARK